MVNSGFKHRSVSKVCASNHCSSFSFSRGAHIAFHQWPSAPCPKSLLLYQLQVFKVLTLLHESHCALFFSSFLLLWSFFFYNPFANDYLLPWTIISHIYTEPLVLSPQLNYKLLAGGGHKLHFKHRFFTITVTRGDQEAIPVLLICKWRARDLNLRMVAPEPMLLGTLSPKATAIMDWGV